MKKIKLIITIFFLICAFSVTAQISDKSNIYLKIDTTYTLISQNNQQKLSISLTENYSDNKFWYREYLVKVYSSTNETTQIFSNINYEARWKEHFQLKDINFDNYDDLLVLVNQNPFNEWYEFWRFDTLSQKYFYDSLFSETVSCNPSFAKDSKTICTGGAEGNTWTFWNETYFYENGQLKLIEEETQDRFELIDPKNFIYSYKRAKKIREGDEMVIVKEIIGTLEEVDEKWSK